MISNEFIALFDVVGAFGFLCATVFGAVNWHRGDVDRPFWLAFTVTAGLGSLWLSFVAIEWLQFSPTVMDRFSTSLQAVIIGMFSLSVIGTYPLVDALEQSRRKTTQRASVVSILSRILRHNLRNDMTVARGQIATLSSESEEATIALEIIDDLVETSEKARKLEQAVVADQRRTRVDLEPLLGRLIDDMRDTNSDANIQLTGTPDSTVTLLPSFETALRELLENAVKHTGADPFVEINVKTTTDRLVIRVIDTGPGIPQSERELFETDVETPLVHSTGVGLWLAQWIIKSHGGTLTADERSTGSVFTIDVPLELPDKSEYREDEIDVPAGFDRFHAVFQHDIDGLVIVDDDHRILEINSTAADLLGVEQSELLGRRLGEVLPTADSVDIPSGPNRKDEAVIGTFHWPSDNGENTSQMYVAKSNIVIGEHLLKLAPSSQRKQHVATS